MRGFSRFYPDGPAVGHLVGYVGVASAKEYEAEKNPLLITPGFKIGKEGLEETLEQRLRGTPGGQRVELTARGKLVREYTVLLDPPVYTPGQESGASAPVAAPILLVGPEGGLAPDEIPVGARKMELGPTVLRTETAAIIGAGLLRLSRDD